MKESTAILNRDTPVNEAELNEMLQREIAQNDHKIVVLDDDPTGTQTVHDVNVYTAWDRDSVLDGFREDSKLFYILTNSRAFTAEKTEAAHREIAASIDHASKITGKDYMIISRCDSTLRGHFPLETSVLREEFEKNTGLKIDGEILCPFFPEGGRYTVGNIHYVRYGDELVPAGETEFAKDKTFGYSSSSLPEYIEKKTDGEYKADDVVCISLDDLRRMDLDGIQAQLMGVRDFGKIIVNSADYADLKVFCIALYRAVNAGKRFMFRSAAGIVKVMGGISDQPLLSRPQMITAESSNGGVIVCGSHTAKTTAQLECLREIDDIQFVELDATLVRDEDAFEKEVQRCLAAEEECIIKGVTVCCYTTRALITADTDDREDDLRLSVRISDAVQSLVGRLSVTPSFVIAKGGITSSDVATKALTIKKAKVLGQIRKGIPVWQAGEESRFPGVPYVVFPGNVGEAETLKEAAEILLGK